MMIGFIVFLIVLAMSINKGRNDVILAFFGYAFAALVITVGIVFGALYLYTNFVYGLWVG